MHESTKKGYQNRFFDETNHFGAMATTLLRNRKIIKKITFSAREKLHMDIKK